MLATPHLLHQHNIDINNIDIYNIYNIEIYNIDIINLDISTMPLSTMTVDTTTKAKFTFRTKKNQNFMSQIPPVHRGLSSCKTAKLALLSVAQICYPVVSFWQLLRVCFAILNYLVLAETPLAFPNNILKKQKDKFSKSIVILISWEVGSSLKEKNISSPKIPKSQNPMACNITSISI